MLSHQILEAGKKQVTPSRRTFVLACPETAQRFLEQGVLASGKTCGFFPSNPFSLLYFLQSKK